MFELAETADELSGEGEEGQEAVSAMLCDIERSVERISVQIQGDWVGYFSLQ
jgi:stress response protein SCP2